jgi:hypothetical protein
LLKESGLKIVPQVLEICLQMESESGWVAYSSEGYTVAGIRPAFVKFPEFAATMPKLS